MRLKNKPWAKDYILENEEFNVTYKEGHKYDWNEIFKNNHPIDIEIGMGKGDFIIESARQNPTVNYVGIEMYPSVQVIALKKAEGSELKNLRLMTMDARHICEVFGENVVRNVYLNFSDPWPKAKHDKRRLTYKTFLSRYEYISNNGDLIFKTDNTGLFEWSIESIEEYGLRIGWITRDLWKEDVHNIRTEYETKFGGKGEHIKKVIAHLGNGYRENKLYQIKYKKIENEEK